MIVVSKNNYIGSVVFSMSEMSALSTWTARLASLLLAQVVGPV
jgi:hypothetical protein